MSDEERHAITLEIAAAAANLRAASQHIKLASQQSKGSKSS